MQGESSVCKALSACTFPARMKRESKLAIKSAARGEEKRGEKKGEMRLQLIMSLAADVLHKSSPLHPGCFHGDGASNCGALARSPAAPAKVDASAGSLPVPPGWGGGEASGEAAGAGER